jgi:hypothetical protein
MTNAEIIEMQRAARAHLVKLPMAVETAKQAIEGKPGHELVELPAGNLSTLLKEIDRLLRLTCRLNEDLRDEAREGQHAAASAYSEGRHEGMRDARGYD